MDAQVTSVMASAGAQLAVLAAKGTVTSISNRIQVIRDKKSREEICDSYEELIHELVAERSPLLIHINQSSIGLKSQIRISSTYRILLVEH